MVFGAKHIIASALLPRVVKQPQANTLFEAPSVYLPIVVVASRAKNSASAANMTYPMERVLYNLHLRVCTYALRTSSHRSRSWAERGLLLLSICCFGVLYMSHRSFVYRPQGRSVVGNIPLNCLSSIRGFNRHAAITHIVLLEDHLHSYPAAAEETSFAYTLQKNRTGDNYCSIGTMSDHTGSLHQPGCNAEHYAYKPTMSSRRRVHFSYSQVKGYLLLPPEIIQEKHDISVQYVKVSPRDNRCFGEPFLQEIIFQVLGPETVILNWLLGLEDAQGYAYHPRTETLIDLHPSEDGPLVLGGHHLIGSKLSVVLRTCFLFFITTTLVAFTLRETQERMLDFTQQLQNHVRHRQPVGQLVTRHLIDNLVFCPIMVGMIFFLIEFYHGDKALAFMVLSIVWLAEVFSVISLRSTNGLHFFPRIFFLLFSLFHFYLFSFPFGFTHTALACTTCFMVHSMLFFCHRYELPAVALGRVSAEQPRMRPSPAEAGTPVWPADIPPLRGEPTVANSMGASHSRHTPTGVTGNDPMHRYHTNSHGDMNTRPSNSSLSTLSVGQNQAPQQTLLRSSSHVSNSSNNNNMSRQTSSSALFFGEEDGDESFVYFMDGEVVMPRQKQSTQQQRIPDHVLAAVDVGGTPRRDNLSLRQQAIGPEHPRTRVAPSFPLLGQRHPSDNSLSHSSAGGT